MCVVNYDTGCKFVLVVTRVAHIGAPMSAISAMAKKKIASWKNRLGGLFETALQAAFRSIVWSVDIYILNWITLLLWSYG